jgi:hypothetical protein
MYASTGGQATGFADLDLLSLAHAAGYQRCDLIRSAEELEQRLSEPITGRECLRVFITSSRPHRALPRPAEPLSAISHRIME